MYMYITEWIDFQMDPVLNPVEHHYMLHVQLLFPFVKEDMSKEQHRYNNSENGMRDGQTSTEEDQAWTSQHGRKWEETGAKRKKTGKHEQHMP